MSKQMLVVGIVSLIIVSLFMACGAPELPEDSCKEMVEHFFKELDDGNWVNAQSFVVSGELPELWQQEGLELESISIEMITDEEAVANISVKYLDEAIEGQYTCVQIGNNWKIEI